MIGFAVIAIVSAIKPIHAHALDRVRSFDLQEIAQSYPQTSDTTVLHTFTGSFPVDNLPGGLLAEGGPGTDLQGQITATSTAKDYLYTAVVDDPQTNAQSVVRESLDGSEYQVVAVGGQFYDLITGWDGDVYGIETASPSSAYSVFVISEDGSYQSYPPISSSIILYKLVRGADAKIYAIGLDLGNTPLTAKVYHVDSTGQLDPVCDFDGIPVRATWASDGNLYSGQQPPQIVEQIPGGSSSVLYSYIGDTSWDEMITGLVDDGSGSLYYTVSPAGATLNVTWSALCVRLPYGGTPQPLSSISVAPNAAVSVIATDGNIYGYTEHFSDTVSIAPSTWAGIFQATGAKAGNLYGYDPAVVGSETVGLVQGVDGAFYGLTVGQGADGPSTVFRVDQGLPARYKIEAAIAPTASTSINNGWYTGAVQVTLTGDSKPISYSIDGHTAQTYSGAFTAAGDGKHTIVYCSADSPAKQTSVEIDGTPPTTTAEVTGQQSGTVFTTPVTIALSARDALSGIASTTYAIDEGATNTYSSAFTVSTSGTHKITYRSTDIAGNVEATQTTSFTIKPPPPPLHQYGLGLQLLAAPVDDSTQSLTDIFDQPITLIVWNPRLGSYTFSPNAPANTLKPGRGYWARVKTITELNDLGTTVAAGSKVNVLLLPGWNMIGDPWATPAASTSITVFDGTSAYSFADAEAQSIINSTIFTYQPGDTEYETQSGEKVTLEPYEGYWLYAYKACTLSFGQ
jgi:hypothetical protein